MIPVALATCIFYHFRAQLSSVSLAKVYRFLQALLCRVHKLTCDMGKLRENKEWNARGNEGQRGSGRWLQMRVGSVVGDVALISSALLDTVCIGAIHESPANRRDDTQENRFPSF